MGRVDIERNAKPLDLVKWKCEYLVDAEDQERRCFVLKEDADSHTYSTMGLLVPKDLIYFLKQHITNGRVWTSKYNIF